MISRTFGPLDRQVAVIGLGTWSLEGDPRAARDAVRAALDQGLTHIDTAEMYGRGRAEEIVGEAIAGRRDEVFLVTKVLPENASRTGVVEACRRSLSRLRTDRLDCFLLHWESSHPLEETIAGFELLVEQGKILSWGVSNFDVTWLEQAWGIAGPGRIACNQVLYHLRERAIEHEVIPWCEEHGVAVIGYSPFGQGNFPTSRSAEGRALEEIARRHGATPRQVALAFLVRRPSLFTIPKTAKTEHVLENAAAAELALDDQDLARIEEAFPLGAPRPGVPTL